MARRLRVSDVAGLQEAIAELTARPTGGGSGSGVSSFNGRTGAVAPQSGDYSASQVGAAASSHAHAIADTTGLQTALDGKAASSHAHAVADTTGLQAALDGKAASAHTHNAADVNAGTLDIARIPLITVAKGGTGLSALGTANQALRVNAGGTALEYYTPSAGSDPWTVLNLASDFTTSSATAVDVTGLSFAPGANLKYMFEALLLLRTNTATVNPRAGLAWATGLTDGVGTIEQSQTATTQLLAMGNIAAALLIAVGGLPNTTQSWPCLIYGMVMAGAAPSGTVRIQMASETAGTVVTVKAGSYIRYRTF